MSHIIVSPLCIKACGSNFVGQANTIDHRATYDNQTFFHIRPAPEFATAEVVLASLYRASGFADISEKDVPASGKEFANDSWKPKVHERSKSQIDMDTWRVVLQGVLESPKQPNQSSKRFLQMCPIVPNVALYSGSARLSGNSWNPGQLVKRLINFGADGNSNATKLWEQLYESLSITDEDDIWARWLRQEFELRRRPETASWKLSALETDDGFLKDDRKLVFTPKIRPFSMRENPVSLT